MPLNKEGKTTASSGVKASFGVFCNIDCQFPNEVSQSVYIDLEIIYLEKW